MNKITEEDLNELSMQGRIIRSPTKPGDGWVKVTPGNMEHINNTLKDLTQIKEKLTRLHAAALSTLSEKK